MRQSPRIALKQGQPQHAGKKKSFIEPKKRHKLEKKTPVKLVKRGGEHVTKSHELRETTEGKAFQKRRGLKKKKNGSYGPPHSMPQEKKGGHLKRIWDKYAGGGRRAKKG